MGKISYFKQLSDGFYYLHLNYDGVRNKFMIKSDGRILKHFFVPKELEGKRVMIRLEFV